MHVAPPGPAAGLPVNESALVGQFGDIMSLRVHNPPEIGVTGSQKMKGQGVSGSYIVYKIEG